MKKTNSQVCVYDITIPYETYKRKDLDALFRSFSKKFVFQGEIGEETEYKHWQCRISLKVAQRESYFKKNGYPCKGNWSITSNENKDNDFYVMKPDTRFEGPYSDKDKPMTWQLQHFMDECEKNMYDYQKSIKSLCPIKDMRTINLIYDEHGDMGKSLFLEYLEYLKIAKQIPPLDNIQDICAMVMEYPNEDAYIMDLPRGISKKDMSNMITGIECIKNGYVFDKRYGYRELRMGRPQIFVFCNKLPNLTYLSKDRWKIWEMHSDKSFTLMNYYELMNKYNFKDEDVA